MVCIRFAWRGSNRQCSPKAGLARTRLHLKQSRSLFRFFCLRSTAQPDGWELKYRTPSGARRPMPGGVAKPSVRSQRRLNGRPQRQQDGEHRAVVGLACHFDAAAMRMHQLAGDVQTQAEAAGMVTFA